MTFLHSVLVAGALFASSGPADVPVTGAALAEQRVPTEPAATGSATTPAVPEPAPTPAPVQPLPSGTEKPGTATTPNVPAIPDAPPATPAATGGASGSGNGDRSGTDPEASPHWKPGDTKNGDMGSNNTDTGSNGSSQTR